MHATTTWLETHRKTADLHFEALGCYDCAMSNTLAALVGDLMVPGRILAFCDETDLTKEATSTMVADIHFHAAVVLPSEDYGPLTAPLAAALQEFGVAEFHAVDIVNNGKKSVWKERNKADRLAALGTICDALCASSGHVYYVHVPKAQYDYYASLLPLSGDHKTGVRTRFRELIAEMLDTPTPAIVIADKDKNSKGLGLAKFEGSDHLLGGGIFLAHSHEILGLQLADAAVYVIGRYLRRRDGMTAAADEDAMDAFDRLIAETVGRLDGRLHSLLSNPALHCQAA
ncbi:DUF3800 domain-containing protein [Mesorhizobium sp. M3A.F.Ca.ET.174.01.1.1]|uniref:DUF3800 domain-containing protein n=1 Tax=unclassified Mesorhizobium TaxID=325217 RepID=UPI0010935DA7|nr:MULTISPECIES: DUF3800 domain-containing protein [unclassified Mesorhizobium]TGS87414.1 DUF3800 domain-containing protein [Mesorhizobium sp. M3A.F.Ca.ET.175.01.1.1]TGT27874.1 DUF3800 domain-containing protein [Mesorhizobium sp. M3A.F.Ca.ET.174.01.1.1]